MLPPHLKKQQIVRKAHMVACGGAVEQRLLGAAAAVPINAYAINEWIAAVCSTVPRSAAAPAQLGGYAGKCA